jgi:hypothetical protein
MNPISWHRPWMTARSGPGSCTRRVRWLVWNRICDDYLIGAPVGVGQAQQSGQRLRLAEQPALRKGHALFAQKIRLLLGFHALADQGQVE